MRRRTNCRPTSAFSIPGRVRDPIYARDVTGWTSHLPDDERSLLVEEICREVELCTNTGDMGPLVHLVRGWRATAEIHSNPSLRAVIGVEHRGPPVPIVRPLSGEERSR